MKNFTYHTQEEKENLEAILARRKRKFNRQQITAGIITFILLGILALYFAFHMYYTEYDGYIHVDANQVRTPFDIYLDSVYVKEGDIVSPGDTLYSYFNIDQLVEHFNINTEPAVISRYRDMTVQMAQLQEQIAVMRARIRELQAQIAVEDHNISFGLSNNSHKLDLQRELNVARVQLQALLQQLGTLSGLRNQSQGDYHRTNHIAGSLRNNGSMIFDDASSAVLYETKSYHLASDSSIVTDINAPDRMVFFEKEEIMTTQHIDLEANNLMVVAYIPIDAMHRITRHSEAEIVVNSDFSFNAHVSVLGLRTEVIPDNLRSYFSKANTAVIALLKIDEGQMVPFWTMADGIPVSIRVRNFDTWGEKPSGRNYLWYKTGEGLQTNLPDDWIYTALTAVDTATVEKATTDTVGQNSEAKERSKARNDSILKAHKARKESQNAKETPGNAAKDKDQKSATNKDETKQPEAKKAETKQPEAKQPEAKQPEAKKAETKQPEKPQAPTQKAVETPVANQCYIIVGALQSEVGAQKSLKYYQEKFPNAGILKQNKIYYIYVNRYNNREEADKRLQTVRKEKSCASAWILVGNTQKK